MAKKKELTIQEKINKINLMAKSINEPIEFDLTDLTFDELEKLYQLWFTKYSAEWEFEREIKLRNLKKRVDK
jgi:hypothetical protein